MSDRASLAGRDPYDLLTVDETAELLTIHPSTVHRLIAAGTLRSVKLGRARRIPVVSLRTYIDGDDPAIPSDHWPPTSALW